MMLWKVRVRVGEATNDTMCLRGYMTDDGCTGGGRTIVVRLGQAESWRCVHALSIGW